MRYLFLSITILFLLSGCKAGFLKNLTVSDTESKKIYNPYFANQGLDYVYKMSIAIFGKEFSGILIIKKIDTNTHRSVFTSQFGSTIFDIQFSGNKHKVISILDDLNKKIILNTLINDFTLLLKENGELEKAYENAQYDVLKAHTDNRYNYYFYTKSNTRLEKITQTSTRKEKFTISFVEIMEEERAKKIEIAHKNIPLKIELNILNN